MVSKDTIRSTETVWPDVIFWPDIHSKQALNLGRSDESV